MANEIGLAREMKCHLVFLFFFVFCVCVGVCVCVCVCVCVRVCDHCIIEYDSLIVFSSCTLVMHKLGFSSNKNATPKEIRQTTNT